MRHLKTARQVWQHTQVKLSIYWLWYSFRKVHMRFCVYHCSGRCYPDLRHSRFYKSRWSQCRSGLYTHAGITSHHSCGHGQNLKRVTRHQLPKMTKFHYKLLIIYGDICWLTAAQFISKVSTVVVVVTHVRQSHTVAIGAFKLIGRAGCESGFLT